jgi:hypothetical protein
MNTNTVHTVLLQIRSNILYRYCAQTIIASIRTIYMSIYYWSTFVVCPVPCSVLYIHTSGDVHTSIYFAAQNCTQFVRYSVLYSYVHQSALSILLYFLQQLHPAVLFYRCLCWLTESRPTKGRPRIFQTKPAWFTREHSTENDSQHEQHFIFLSLYICICCSFWVELYPEIYCMLFAQ